MPFHFGAVLAFLLIGLLFPFITLVAGRLVRPATAAGENREVYECGEAPLGGGWFNFNPRFVLVALTFLVFDVEVVFTYPVAVAFRRFLERGEGLVAFVEIAAFVLILLAGLAYVWRRGDLDWLRAERE